jgi:GxxExxY protein
MGDRDSLTERVIGAAIDVHRELGPGSLESVYQKCLCHELRPRQIAHQSLVRLPIVYKGEVVGDDLVMDVFFPGRRRA